MFSHLCIKPNNRRLGKTWATFQTEPPPWSPDPSSSSTSTLAALGSQTRSIFNKKHMDISSCFPPMISAWRRCTSTFSTQCQLPETIDTTFSFSFSDLKNVHLATPLLSQGWHFHGRAFLPGLLGRAPPTWTRRSVARASHRRRILQPSASISWWLRPSCSGSLGGLRVPQEPRIGVLLDFVKLKSKIFFWLIYYIVKSCDNSGTQGYISLTWSTADTNVCKSPPISHSLSC